MRVLISGGTGFIGGRLVSKLLEDGNNVIILTTAQKLERLSNPYEW